MPKATFHAENILDRCVCESHKQALENGCSCNNEEIPYILAPCMILNAETWCPFYVLTPTSKSKSSQAKMEQKCRFEYPFAFQPLSAEEKNIPCSVCGFPATIKALPKESTRISRKLLYFCEKHKQPIGCSNPSNNLESAPCHLFSKKSHCMRFQIA
jgi:hypothetical protein